MGTKGRVFECAIKAESAIKGGRPGGEKFYSVLNNYTPPSNILRRNTQQTANRDKTQLGRLKGWCVYVTIEHNHRYL